MATSASVSADIGADVHSDSDSKAQSEGDEIHPLITLYPKYKHCRPLSPTPIDSMQSTESHSPIQPFKSHSFLFFNHPTQTFTPKQLCDYIDLIVMKHISTSNQSIPHIKNALRTLRTHLIIDCDLNHLIIPSTLNIITDDIQCPLKNPNHPTLQSKPKCEPSLISKKPPKWCTHSTQRLWGAFLPSSALMRHPLYSIDVDKHCGVLRGSVRQDWNTIETDDDEERNWVELSPHWFELFFDLMFVAAIVHISTEVADAYQSGEYLFICIVFPQFGLFILCWLDIVLYHSRFRMTQTTDGLLRFVYMSFVLMMGLSISTNDISHKLFLISYMCNKLIMTIMFIKTLFISRARPHGVYMIIENGVSIVSVVCIVIFVHIEAWSLIVIYSILFIYSWSHIAVFVYLKRIRDLGVNIPINVPHIAERMGAFVLIILGETIISLMVQHVEYTNTEGIMTVYTVTLSWFVIVYCIGKLYFESQPTEHEILHHKKSHAMSISVWRARIYKWFHMLLFFGLLGLGLGSKITVHELHAYHGDESMYVFIPGVSCIVICICINVIRLTHPFDYSDKHPQLVAGVWILRVLCVVMMGAILFLWQSVNHFVILIVYVICFIVQIVVDFEAKTRLIIIKTEDKDKSLRFYRSSKGTLHLIGKGEGKGKQNEEDVDKIECTVNTREISFIGTF